jgi:hypothetical protein
MPISNSTLYKIWKHRKDRIYFFYELRSLLHITNNTVHTGKKK